MPEIHNYVDWPIMIALAYGIVTKDLLGYVRTKEQDEATMEKHYEDFKQHEEKLKYRKDGTVGIENLNRIHSTRKAHEQQVEIRDSKSPQHPLQDIESVHALHKAIQYLANHAIADKAKNTRIRQLTEEFHNKTLINTQGLIDALNVLIKEKPVISDESGKYTQHRKNTALGAYLHAKYLHYTYIKELLIVIQVYEKKASEELKKQQILTQALSKMFKNIQNLSNRDVTSIIQKQLLPIRTFPSSFGFWKTTTTDPTQTKQELSLTLPQRVSNAEDYISRVDERQKQFRPKSPSKPRKQPFTTHDIPYLRLSKTLANIHQPPPLNPPLTLCTTCYSEYYKRRK